MDVTQGEVPHVSNGTEGPQQVQALCAFPSYARVLRAPHSQAEWSRNIPTTAQDAWKSSSITAQEPK